MRKLLSLLCGLFALALATPVFAQNALPAGPADLTTKAVCVSAPLVALDTGFTLTHEVVDVNAEAACTTKQGGGASVDGANNIVKHYDDPELRKRVQSLLIRMATDGARVMRTVVWFRHAEDAPMAARLKDPLGLLVATDGALSPKEVSNIVNYVSDAQAAGYHRFFAVVGPQGTSNPKCRKGVEWGGCYDEQFLERSWSVISQVVTALHSPQLSKIDIIVDIAPESCTPVPSKLVVDRNLVAYSRYMLSRYREEFGDQQFIISCGAGIVARALPGLVTQENLFHELGVRPASLDVHMYETDSKKVRDFLIQADATARRLGIPLDITETYYDHPSIFRLVSDLKSSKQLLSLRSLLVWPRRTKSACQIDARPPYDMNALDADLGRRTPEGGILPTCR